MNNKKHQPSLQKSFETTNFHLLKIYIPIEDWNKIIVYINSANSHYQNPSQFIRAAIEEKLKKQEKTK